MNHDPDLECDDEISKLLFPFNSPLPQTKSSL